MGKKDPVLQILDICALMAASNHRCEEREVEAILSEVNSRPFKRLVTFFYHVFFFFWEIDIEDYDILKQPHIWEIL